MRSLYCVRLPIKKLIIKINKPNKSVQSLNEEVGMIRQLALSLISLLLDNCLCSDGNSNLAFFNAGIPSIFIKLSAYLTPKTKLKQKIS